MVLQYMVIHNMDSEEVRNNMDSEEVRNDAGGHGTRLMAPRTRAGRVRGVGWGHGFVFA